MYSAFMRKSSAVPLTLLAALAAFTTGCRDTPESRNCVDAQGRIVPESNCSTGPSSAGVGGYHYIYGGASGGRVGDAVVGGSTTPSSGVSRGGFGGGDGGGE
jgi:hypothetical protein